MNLLSKCLICIFCSSLCSCIHVASDDQVFDTPDFAALIHKVESGWNEGNALKAADCFTEDAIYSSPPDTTYRKGKQALYAFFGGAKGRDAAMHMKIHHYAYNREDAIGYAEYTFQFKSYQAHGIVVIKISNGKISNWRELEMPSSLTWDQFIGTNKF